MKKKHLFYLIICLFFLFFLILFNFSTFQATSVDDLFAIYNAEKRISNPVHKSDVEQYMTPLDHALGIPEQKLEYIANALEQYPDLGKNIDSIPTEAAIEDVQFLFDVLKYSYAGYSYFATEDIWNDRENRITSSIEMYDTDIKREELFQMLCTNLDFIQDSHFKINSYSPIVHSDFYYNDTMEIKQDSRGYYVKDGRQKWYIKSVDNHEDVEDYVKPSLNADGKLCYYLGVLDTQSHIQLNVGFQSDNKEYKTPIKVSRSKPQINQSENAYSYQTIDKIPVITMERMYKKNSKDYSIEEFTESANIISDQNLAILDLRGNMGGQDWGPDVWFQNFTGDSQIPQLSTLKLSSKIGIHELMEIYQTAKKHALFPPEELLQLEAELSSVDPTKNRWIFTEGKMEQKKNKTKLIVLMDGNTASAAESLISHLNTLKNVVFIGTNTSGCFLSNANMKCILPNSEIEISYGDQLSFQDECTEGKGFQPDIWIGGTDALERVLAFLKNIND